MNTIVVIPTYNERQNISALIPAIHRVVPDLHILVVDDNSPDGTGQAVLDLAADQGGKISLLSRPGKDGLAQAYSAGFKEALHRGYDFILQMDADRHACSASQAPGRRKQSAVETREDKRDRARELGL